MLRSRLRKPSPAMLVALLALSVALGGTTYAATGGNFILGQPNSASSPTSLSAPIADKALQLTNTSTASGATALGLTVGSGKPPLTTNSATKVANLNADRLDGHDSSFFLPVFGKAADADKLDGKDSSAFIQGQGRILTFDQTLQAGQGKELFQLPGLVASFDAFCPTQPTSALAFYRVIAPIDSSVNVVADNGGTDPSVMNITAGNGHDFNAAPAGDWLTFSFESGGKVATVFGFSYAFHNPVLNKDLCQFQGHTIVEGA